MSSIAVIQNKGSGLASPALEVEDYAPILIEKKAGTDSSLQDLDDCQQAKATNTTSFRRTLSADMSSEKWLAENGMKRIASFQHLPDQNELKGKTEAENPCQSDIWSSILSKKSEAVELPTYVHPLVRKSSSSLSKKSLEICTESLGSETGSEGFPSDPSSEKRVTEEKTKEQAGPEPEQEQVQVIARYNYSATVAARASKKPQTFPPPIASLQMHSHRLRGKLVLDASLFPANNFFLTQRQDGRLLLTLNNQEKGLSEIAEEVVMSQNLVAQHLPLKSPAASANAFEYSWSFKSKSKSIVKVTPSSTNPDAFEAQELEMLKGNFKKDSLILLLRGCKKFKRSLLIWEPYCIAS